ncbi:hypothetical protein, partial [Escherichia coli]|uniref:hypothetical protein n=2 Tax=Escherichia coli TaxID=562 RepID=UPI002F969CB4
GAGRTSDGNGSHASTLKSPSYTKSVSWQHYQAQFIENYPYYRKGQTLMPHLPENNAHFVSNLIRQTQSGEFIVTSLKLPASS